MNFDFNINSIFRKPDSDFLILHSNDIPKQTETPSQFRLKHPENDNAVRFLDEIGAASAKAQNLSAAITSHSRFVYSNHKLFIKVNGNQMIGFIKIGVKNLIYTGISGKLMEISPVCVLDFYVHETLQRHGFGKLLFEKVLEIEKLEPYQMAIDRPSSKFLFFLNKHYKLKEYRTQSNNFVIFNQFFETKEDKLLPHRAHYHLKTVGDKEVQQRMNSRDKSNPLPKSNSQNKQPNEPVQDCKFQKKEIENLKDKRSYAVEKDMPISANLDKQKDEQR